MKILVIGSHGMLGKTLVNSLSCRSDFKHMKAVIVSANSNHVDIANNSNTSLFIAGVMPDVIINCAAFTNVDACETENVRAFAINTTGPRNIALAARHCRAKVVHISTDYVFDGVGNRPYDENDLPNPLSVYGRSKLEGERAIRETIDNYVIIRTAWLFGPYGKNFITAILDRGKKHHAVSVVTDQYGSPTYTADLANAIGNIVSLDLRGLYHVTNAGICSRYEWAKKIFEITGMQTSLLPLKASDYKRAATVPHNSSFNCTKYTRDSKQKIRPWQDALEDYLHSYVIKTTENKNA
ncbi:MAG: dTDP-4-dehydrorhamnose reductase [Candidatus Brocadiaceae bacterium]|nr:dTDP-4-dehydrorhamnose reductase [Candidatus Brocadiaceae bacterium]